MTKTIEKLSDGKTYERIPPPQMISIAENYIILREVKNDMPEILPGDRCQAWCMELPSDWFTVSYVTEAYGKKRYWHCEREAKFSYWPEECVYQIHRNGSKIWERSK